MRDRQHERGSARPNEINLTVNRRRPRRKSDRNSTTVEDRSLFSACFEHAAIGLSITDLDGRILDVNSAYCSITGYTESELRNIIDSQTLVHAADLPRVREKIRSLITGEVPAFVIEQRYVKKDGSIAWVQNSVSIVRDQARRPVKIATVTQDITERKVTEASLSEIEARKRAEQEAARNYSRRLIEAQEAERRRISRELHDQVGQVLTAVKMNLHALQYELTETTTRLSIDHNLRAIDEAVDQVRDLSVDLRPLLLDDFGLVVAVRWYLERETRDIGIPAKFVSGSVSEDDRFSTELETACFRIVQEGVTNIVRHAKAKRISVTLERVLSDLILLISDDGAGFDARSLRNGAAGTLGLRGMEERAQAVGGTIIIDSAPKVGTEICVRFPIREEAVNHKKAQKTQTAREGTQKGRMRAGAACP